MERSYNNFFKIFLIALALVFSWGNDLASLSIYIYDENGSALQGASILLEENQSQETIGISTNENGRAYFENVTIGEYSLQSTFIGYDDINKKIIIKSAQVYEFKFQMNLNTIAITELEIINNYNNQSMVGAATSIGAKDLEIITPMGTQEILERVPGINGFSDDGIGNSRINVGIRGINPRRSSRVLILEDGVPIQPALYVYPNMYYNPPSERISEVEVVKGSGAISFGPQTMGGVINYLTKRSTEGSKPSFKLMGGENNYKSILLDTGDFSKNKFNPELQFLYKSGDGFRDNNDFVQYNGTLKLNFDKSKNESFYSKTNINYENSNATYTGLTVHSFETNPTFNPKEDDNFKIFRASSDLIHTKKISQNTTSTTTTFISFFDRKWWRENDVFIKSNDIDAIDPNPITPSSPLTKIRVGDGKTSLGILRTFYVAGIEKKWSINNMFMNNPSSLEIGGRVYFERFLDDKKKGYSPDARDGYYFIAAEEYTDSDDSGSYEDGEEFIDCNENGSICEGDAAWDSSMGDGEWNNVSVVGQSHHYQTSAFSGFISQTIKYNENSSEEMTIKPGIRLEIFEQERIDRLVGSQYQDNTTIVLLPGIGFNKKINDMNIFGGIHRGFTPPSSGALNVLDFGECDCGLDLDAEKSWNKELGLRYNTNSINLEIAAFHIDIENLVAAGRGTVFKNLGKVQTMGLEIGSSLYFSNFLMPNIHLAYGYLHTEVIDGRIQSSFPGESNEVSIAGKKLPYTPEHTLTLSFEKNLFNKITSRLDFKYVGSAYSDFENIEYADINPWINSLGISGPIPEHSILNFSSIYSVNEKLKLSLIVKNLTDEIYIGSRLHSNPGQTAANMSSGIIPGPRRQINFGINYTF